MYFLATFGTSWPFFAAFGTLLTRFLEAFLDAFLEAFLDAFMETLLDALLDACWREEIFKKASKNKHFGALF